jgi:hypothetical protein
MKSLPKTQKPVSSNKIVNPGVITRSAENKNSSQIRTTKQITTNKFGKTNSQMQELRRLGRDTSFLPPIVSEVNEEESEEEEMTLTPVPKVMSLKVDKREPSQESEEELPKSPEPVLKEINDFEID